MSRWDNAPLDGTRTPWITQQAAADELQVGLLRVGVLIANRHLTPASGPDGEPGVTVLSVVQERAWRGRATLTQKVGRVVKDAVNWF